MKVSVNLLSMDDVRVRMADNLRRLRKERGLSQELLALEAGVDRTMLSKIERRIANPSIETLLKLANRLAVDLRDLLAPIGRAGATLDGERYRVDRQGFPSSPIIVHQSRRSLR
jgi:transcriptional regulator with XRE-family HTH domain